jgi:hypothetical protein
MLVEYGSIKHEDNKFGSHHAFLEKSSSGLLMGKIFEI